MSAFLYFAYGSNLLLARLRQRTPSARAIGVARLPGYELRWHKAGRDNSGKCDVIALPDCREPVQGVVDEIARREKAALDAAEDLGLGYTEKAVEVEMGDGRLIATAYLALLVDPSAVPYSWYRTLVVSGARENGLDATYVQGLESVAAKVDPDYEREAIHLSLLLRT
jgi:gamma-glutamylcyclotransferase